MNVTKKFIARKIAQNLSISTNLSKDFLDKFIHIVIENSSNKTVKIKNFGSFMTTETAKRIGRNPKTKESYIIAPRNKIVYISSKFVRKLVN
tara:strand:+ start:59 stop:334 length:276 start_codon:yes stop_codon:yes gene_type:complete